MYLTCKGRSFVLQVTWMFLSPSMANRILKLGYFKKYDVSSISKLNLSGAIFTAKSQIKLKECFPSADVIQIYGKMTKISWKFLS